MDTKREARYNRETQLSMTQTNTGRGYNLRRANEDRDTDGQKDRQTVTTKWIDKLLDDTRTRDTDKESWEPMETRYCQS